MKVSVYDSPGCECSLAVFALSMQNKAGEWSLGMGQNSQTTVSFPMNSKLNYIMDSHSQTNSTFWPMPLNIMPASGYSVVFHLRHRTSPASSNCY